MGGSHRMYFFMFPKKMISLVEVWARRDLLCLLSNVTISKMISTSCEQISSHLYRHTEVQRIFLPPALNHVRFYTVSVKHRESRSARQNREPSARKRHLQVTTFAVSHFWSATYFDFRYSRQHSPFCILSMARSTPKGTPLSSASPTTKLTSLQSNSLPLQVPSRCTVIITRGLLSFTTPSADHQLSVRTISFFLPWTFAPSFGLEKPSPLTLILRRMPPSLVKVSPSNLSSSICFVAKVESRHCVVWNHYNTRSNRSLRSIWCWRGWRKRQ